MTSSKYIIRRIFQRASFRRRFLCAISMGAALFLASCGKAPTKSQSEAFLARVGEKLITSEDLRAEAARRSSLKRPVPAKDVLLNDMIEHEALLQKAKTAALDKDPEIQREIENILIEKLLERDLRPRVSALQISSEDAKISYESNIAKHTQPALIRIALLYLPLSEKMSEANREEIRNRMAEARAKALETSGNPAESATPRGFGTLAINYSDDPASRYRGGDIGWLEQGSQSHHWPREVLEVASRQEVGIISPVLETESGLFLVMKTDARESAVRPFSQVEPAIRQTLLVQKRRELEESYRQEIHRLLGVNINAEALASVQLPRQEKLLARQNESEPPGLPVRQQSLNHGN